jgi:hypothetical protein
VGCCPRTIYNTARRDTAFRDEIQQARARRELSLLNRIEEAAREPRYWRAAAWLLERLHPARYGPQSTKTIPLAAHRAGLDHLLDIVHQETRTHTDLYPRIADRLRTDLPLRSAHLDGHAETALDLFIRSQEDPNPD